MNNHDLLITEKYKEAVKDLDASILLDGNLWYKYVLDLPEKLSVIYTIVVFHRQVFNGGFHQYFFNRYGQFSYITIENLKKINAPNIANILSRALSEVNKEGYSIEDFREKVSSRQIGRINSFDNDLCEFLDKLDTEYFDLLNEDLEELLGEYLLE